MNGRKLLKGAFWPGFYAISAIGVSFMISVLSARLLGVHGYGTLQFVLSVAQLLQIGFGLGMATQVLRASGEEGPSNDPSALDVLVKRSVGFFLFLLFLVGVPGFVIWGWLEGLEQLTLLGVATAFAITQHLVSIYRSALVGKSRFIAAGFGEFIAGVAALTILGGLLLLASTVELDPTSILLVRTGTAALGSLFLFISWKTRRASASMSKTVVIDRRAIFGMARVGLPIMLIGVGAILNSSADIIMIGWMRSSAEVGEYHVATRAALLIGLPLSVVMIPLSPLISRLHRTNRRELRALVFKSTALVGAGAFLIALFLFVFMDRLLGLFGPDFLGSRNIAIGLGIAQLVNAAFGPMQQLLIMTGYQKKASGTMLVSVAINIGFNLILIPPYGALGAVIGTGLGIVINSLLNSWFVWRELFSEPALQVVKLADAKTDC